MRVTGRSEGKPCAASLGRGWAFGQRKRKYMCDMPSSMRAVWTAPASTICRKLEYMTCKVQLSLSGTGCSAHDFCRMLDLTAGQVVRCCSHEVLESGTKPLQVERCASTHPVCEAVPLGAACAGARTLRTPGRALARQA